MTRETRGTARLIRRASVSWRNPRTRAMVWQVLAVGAVTAVVAVLANQAATNLRLRGIASGFDYLRRGAGFEITPGPLAYSSRDSYARALGIGLVNTLRVSLIGIVVATLFGPLVGVARLSNLRPVSAIAGAYVEVLRNTPLLLQLFFWYALSQALPGPARALHLFGVFVSNRGVNLPWLVWHDGAIGIGRPVLAGFNFRGGVCISPEFAALLIGLSTYTAAFLAEIVRGGVLAVDKGQTAAAAALGLTRGRILRLVVFPQALRAIIPPATTQYLNLAKNSSLAVAIGYPDLLSITNTTLNQTGQAIEAIAIAMILYLAIGLTASVAMNLYGDAPGARVRGRSR